MLTFLVLLLVPSYLYGQYIKGFDDTVMFDVNWPRDNIKDLELLEEDHMIITTAFREKYKCYLPNLNRKVRRAVRNYKGPSPLELIAPIFGQTTCSYRIETYWTYEVCHGRYIRQYHESREGKISQTQEYVLGQWPKKYHEVLIAKMKEEAAKEKENETDSTLNEEEEDEEDLKIPMKRIDGVKLPYFQVVMENGTKCELKKNKPRQTNVIYVCYVHGKHEIFSIKEVASCVYEVIILSPSLCAHPLYKPPDISSHQVNCTPVENHPTIPRRLDKMKREATYFRFKQDLDRIRVEVHPIEQEKEESLTSLETPIDTSPVQEFLEGRNCLVGGTGWWQYEFCYGRHVEQFHAEKGSSRIAINLGRFNKAKHLEWLVANPQKRPKPIGQRTQLSHLYADGSVCDKTGKPRKTEVKLKCLHKPSTPGAVSLYLLEPRFCEYILGVESPLICDILARADENGMIPNSDDDGIIEDEISTVNIVRG